MWQRMVGSRLHLCWIRPRFIDTVVDTRPMAKVVRKLCQNERYQNMLLQQKSEENLGKISKACDHTVLHQLPGMMDVFIFSLIGKFILFIKSYNSHRSSRPRSVISMAESRASTVKSAKSAKSKVIITSVPNPFCPKIKGMCCLMLLLNLGLILVTLGLVIVVQFFEPIFVW